MYICICLGITEKEVKEVIKNGASSYEEIKNSLGVGGGCGCCNDFIRRILEENR